MNLSSTLRKKTVAVAAATAIALGLLGALSTGGAAEAASAQPTTQQINRDLAAARAATAKYHRVEVAVADGFLDTGHCVASPDGGMGYHFVNPARMGDNHLDVREPEVLLYEKDAAGRHRLTGVEYIGNTGDALFGRTFTPTPAGPALHVWLWKHNPSGMFADWNPNVGC
jgi:hypothetical protein